MRIVVEQASKRIGSRTIWSNLSNTFEAGAMHAIVGASGSGKSTLLNCIGLIDRASGGFIKFDDRDLNNGSMRQRRLHRQADIGYLFQDYALVDYDSVRANIEFANARWWRTGRMTQAVTGALDQVGLAGREKDRVYQLSGGQKQRVALARILVRRSQVILADEPTGALDRANAETVINLLRRRASEGACVLIATHDSWVVSQSDTTLDLDQFSPQ